jgi:hypothetical protein
MTGYWNNLTLKSSVRNNRHGSPASGGRLGRFLFQEMICLHQETLKV